MCMACGVVKYDEKKAEGFADGLVDTLNKGALSLMISIGHRTGLFDKMAETGASTSEELADKAGLNERYVREWLGAMVTGGIVDYDEESGRYTLPKEHASFLTRKSAPDNIAVFAQYISVLGSVEDDIVQCFTKGGGVPYEKYKRFHSVMAEDSGQTVLASIEEHIIPLIDGLKEKLETGIKVLDVGCGAGRAMNMLAELYPNSTFTGIDLSSEAIETAREEARSKGVNNVDFVVSDLSDFNDRAGEGEYDWVTTFDAVHDQAKPLNVLKGIYKSLKDDGVYLMQDIHSTGSVNENKKHPVGTLLYTISCMHCMTVSLAQGGDGLGAMWGRVKAGELLEEAGFKDVSIHRLEHDFQNDYYVISK